MEICFAWNFVAKDRHVQIFVLYIEDFSNSNFWLVNFLTNGIFSLVVVIRRIDGSFSSIEHLTSDSSSWLTSDNANLFCETRTERKCWSIRAEIWTHPPAPSHRRDGNCAQWPHLGVGYCSKGITDVMKIVLNDLI
jgi:hypothetical protein